MPELTYYRAHLERLLDAMRAVTDQERSFLHHTCLLRFASEEAADEFNVAWAEAENYLSR